jgi:hypothetical protein
MNKHYSHGSKLDDDRILVCPTAMHHSYKTMCVSKFSLKLFPDSEIVKTELNQRSFIINGENGPQ